MLEHFSSSYPERNRVFGGPAHMDTVNYIYHELEQTGYYDVYKQRQIHLWSKNEQNLTVNDARIDARPITYSPSVDITADLVLVANLGCDAADYPDKVTGKIVTFQRGNCSFTEKSVLAAAAGVEAAIVYNNGDGPLSGTLGSAANELGEYAPILGISRADGLGLLEQMRTATLKVHVYINSLKENRITYNVIAQTKEGDPDHVVTLGGHSDSVEAGPGINDDGSGTITNLVIAKALSQFSVKNAVRFFFWTAEEFGLLGSKYYVSSLSADELAKIRLYLNFDMVASPNYALMIYDGDGSAFNKPGPAGSAEIENLFETYFATLDLPWISAGFDGRSDYAAFIDHGIPAGGVTTGAEGIMGEEEAEMFNGKAGVAYDLNYHGVGDDTSNLNHEAFLINSKAAAYAVATYARDLDSIPARATAARRHASHDSSCFHSLVSE